MAISCLCGQEQQVRDCNPCSISTDSTLVLDFRGNICIFVYRHLFTFIQLNEAKMLSV